MEAIGKTVARIEEGPAGEYGPDQEVVLVHFTDGTALKVEGASYEDVSQSVSDVSLADVRVIQRRAAGYREQQRLKRLQRQEWMSISCEERGERKRAQEAKMGPFARMMRDDMQGAYADLLVQSSRMFFGGRPERRVHQPCENCGERRCPNATVKVYEAVPAPPFSKTFTVQVQGGTLQ